MQEEIAKEVMEMAAMKAKRAGQDVRQLKDMVYSDIWRFKSRQVTGDEGKLG
jgi:hypothetical protein